MKTMLLLLLVLPTSLMTTLPPRPTPSRRTSRWKFSTEATAQLFFQLHSGVGEKGEFFATGKSMNRGSFENPPSPPSPPSRLPPTCSHFPRAARGRLEVGGERGMHRREGEGTRSTFTIITKLSLRVPFLSYLPQHLSSLLPLFLSLSCTHRHVDTHTHSHSQTQKQTRTHTHTHTQSLSPSHKYTL